MINFGMFEMEVATKRILREREEFDTVTVHAESFESLQEKIGFAELIARGWLYPSGKYNGEFLGTDGFWEVAGEGIEERAIRKKREEETFQTTSTPERHVCDMCTLLLEGAPLDGSATHFVVCSGCLNWLYNEEIPPRYLKTIEEWAYLGIRTFAPEDLRTIQKIRDYWGV